MTSALMIPVELVMFCNGQATLIVTKTETDVSNSQVHMRCCINTKTKEKVEPFYGNSYDILL